VTVESDIAALASASRERVVIGFAGPPGAGKTTLARRVLAHAAETLGPDAVGYLPMDGFHLSDDVLDALGRRDRKGAPDTFDAAGFVALLHRVVAAESDVYAPDFDHTMGEPIAARLVIPASARLVVAEGNYLGLDEPEWNMVRPLLTRLYYVDAETGVRRRRLLTRHIAAGKTPEQAARWIDTVDEPNAARVASTRVVADAVIDASTETGTPPAG
jgi:pantothenate kinase